MSKFGLWVNPGLKGWSLAMAPGMSLFQFTTGVTYDDGSPGVPRKSSFESRSEDRIGTTEISVRYSTPCKSFGLA
jgi:hypothetical protein